MNVEFPGACGIKYWSIVVFKVKNSVTLTSIDFEPLRKNKNNHFGFLSVLVNPFKHKISLIA